MLSLGCYLCVGFARGLWSMGLSTSGPPALAGVLVSFFSHRLLAVTSTWALANRNAPHEARIVITVRIPDRVLLSVQGQSRRASAIKHSVRQRMEVYPRAQVAQDPKEKTPLPGKRARALRFIATATRTRPIQFSHDCRRQVTRGRPRKLARASWALTSPRSCPTRRSGRRGGEKGG